MFLLLLLFLLYFYNLHTDFPLIRNANVSPIVPIVSGEVDFVTFAVYSKGGHLGYSTSPNFTILRTWSQVILHVKFENCRSSGFIEENV